MLPPPGLDVHKTSDAARTCILLMLRPPPTRDRLSTRLNLQTMSHPGGMADPSPESNSHETTGSSAAFPGLPEPANTIPGGQRPRGASPSLKGHSRPEGPECDRSSHRARGRVARVVGLGDAGRTVIAPRRGPELPALRSMLTFPPFRNYLPSLRNYLRRGTVPALPPTSQCPGNTSWKLGFGKGVRDGGNASDASAGDEAPCTAWCPSPPLDR